MKLLFSWKTWTINLHLLVKILSLALENRVAFMLQCWLYSSWGEKGRLLRIWKRKKMKKRKRFMLKRKEKKRVEKVWKKKWQTWVMPTNVNQRCNIQTKRNGKLSSEWLRVRKVNALLDFGNFVSNIFRYDPFLLTNPYYNPWKSFMICAFMISMWFS